MICWGQGMVTQRLELEVWEQHHNSVSNKSIVWSDIVKSLIFVVTLDAVGKVVMCVQSFIAALISNIMGSLLKIIHPLIIQQNRNMSSTKRSKKIIFRPNQYFILHATFLLLLYWYFIHLLMSMANHNWAKKPLKPSSCWDIIRDASNPILLPNE